MHSIGKRKRHREDRGDADAAGEQKIFRPPGAEREMVARLVHRWAKDRPTAASLEAELDALRTKMRHVFERIFTP